MGRTNQGRWGTQERPAPNGTGLGRGGQKESTGGVGQRPQRTGQRRRSQATRAASLLGTRAPEEGGGVRRGAQGEEAPAGQRREEPVTSAQRSTRAGGEAGKHAPEFEHGVLKARGLWDRARVAKRRSRQDKTTGSQWGPWRPERTCPRERVTTRRRGRSQGHEILPCS